MTPLTLFTPRTKFVLVEIDPREQILESGLVVGIAQIERPQVLMGRVLTRGPLVDRDIVVGSRVTLEKTSAYVAMEQDGKELVMVHEDQLLTVESKDGDDGDEEAA